MISNVTLRSLVLVCCGLVITTGCTRWIEMMASPIEGQEPASQTIARDEQVPLIMDRIRITRNGSPQNPSMRRNNGFSAHWGTSDYSRTLLE